MTLITKWHDMDDGSAVVTRSQDLAPVIEHCKNLRDANPHSKGDFTHVASIPNSIIEHYCNTHKITLREFNSNPEHIKRLVNAKENEAFRVWKGTI